MRYLLYLVTDGDGMALMLVSEDQPVPRDAQLVRSFTNRQTALAALANLEAEFVLPLQRCLARPEAQA